MEITDIIGAVVVVIVIVGKVLFSLKTKSDDASNNYEVASPPRQDFTWEELFGNIRNTGGQNIPEGKVYSSGEVKVTPVVQDVPRIRQYQAAAEYTESAVSCACAEKVSSQEEADDSGDHEKIDWASVIRNNRTEAVILSEILAPPPSLR